MYMAGIVYQDGMFIDSMFIDGMFIDSMFIDGMFIDAILQVLHTMSGMFNLWF